MFEKWFRQERMQRLTAWDSVGPLWWIADDRHVRDFTHLMDNRKDWISMPPIGIQDGR
jgi:hypothetical protein